MEGEVILGNLIQGLKPCSITHHGVARFLPGRVGFKGHWEANPATQQTVDIPSGKQAAASGVFTVLQPESA